MNLLATAIITIAGVLLFAGAVLTLTLALRGDENAMGICFAVGFTVLTVGVLGAVLWSLDQVFPGVVV